MAASEKTKARKLAEKVEREGRFGPDAPDDYKQAVDEFGNKAGAAAYGLATLGRILSKVPKAVTARKGRSEEEMQELSREVAKGMKCGGKVKKMAAGGAVKGAGAAIKGVKPCKIR